MYCGNCHFVFLRLHGLLCERLTLIRDKSIDILTEHEQHESGGLSGSDDHPIAAVALGMKSLLGKYIITRGWYTKGVAGKSGQTLIGRLLIVI